MITVGLMRMQGSAHMQCLKGKVFLQVNRSAVRNLNTNPIAIREKKNVRCLS